MFADITALYPAPILPLPVPRKHHVPESTAVPPAFACRRNYFHVLGRPRKRSDGLA